MFELVFVVFRDEMIGYLDEEGEIKSMMLLGFSIFEVRIEMVGY